MELVDTKYAFLNQAWRIFSGPLLLLLIPLFLSPEVQGYWFSIVSLAALVVFADLGFGTIILQFASHASSELKISVDGKIVGDQSEVIRLAALLRFSLRWIMVVSLLALPFIVMFGAFFLAQNESEVEWLVPWVLCSVFSFFVFVNGALLSFIEGCGFVAEVHKLRLYIAIVTTLFTVVCLISGFDLYALAASFFASSCVGLALISTRFIGLLSVLLRLSGEQQYSWSEEIFPLIWRYAVSWISGYFIFQTITPIAFMYQGAEFAGKVGLTLSIWMAIFQMSSVWIQVSTYKINRLVALGDRDGLDNLFFRNMTLSFLTYIFGCISVYVCLNIDIIFDFLGDRIVSWSSLLIVSIAFMFQVFINGFSIYVRSHKKEPIMIPSVIVSLLVPFLTVLSIKYLGVDFYFLGIMSGFVFVLPWVFIIYTKFKKKSKYHCI